MLTNLRIKDVVQFSMLIGRVIALQARAVLQVFSHESKQGILSWPENYEEHSYSDFIKSFPNVVKVHAAKEV